MGQDIVTVDFTEEDSHDALWDIPYDSCEVFFLDFDIHKNLSNLSIFDCSHLTAPATYLLPKKNPLLDILKSIGHVWAVKNSLKTTYFTEDMNIDMSSIYLRIIKFSHTITLKILKSLNKIKKFLKNLDINKCRYYLRLVPTLPQEYLLQSCIRKTSPPYLF